MLADGRVGPAEGAFTNCTSMLACFCPRGGSPSEAVKAGQNSKPWLTDCLRSRSIHSLEVGPVQQPMGGFQRGNALADRMR